LGGVKYISEQANKELIKQKGRAYGFHERDSKKQVYKWSSELGRVAKVLTNSNKVSSEGVVGYEARHDLTPLRSTPPHHLSKRNKRLFWANLYGQLSQVQPTYSIEAWKLVVGICEGLLRESDFSVSKAVKALRHALHPGRVVGERDAESVRSILERGIIPDDLCQLVWSRLKLGVPSMFDSDPPQRQGADKMHTSAEQKVEEVLKLVWSEVVQGKSLIVSAGFRELYLPHLPNSPLARIPKYDAKGNERPTGRVIRNHSYPKNLSVNDKASGTPSEWEIMLPTIHHLIQTILFYKQQLPGIPILVCKRDVSAAFEWCGLHEDLIPYMGSFIADVERSGFGDSFVLPMRATFGYVHSPSEWAINGNAIDVLNTSSQPLHGRRDGKWPLDVQGYVDDYMLITPDIGLRRWLLTETVESHMKGMLGNTAVNEKKNLEEGGYDTKGILLGFLVDTEEETISLSAEKLERARNFLMDPMFDWGNKKITINDLQKLLGRLYHWSVACRPAQAFIAGCLRMLSKGGGLYIIPGFDDDSVQMGWERFWADIAWLRRIFNEDILVSVKLTAPFLTLQHPILRYIQAKEQDRFFLIGTDATEWSIAAVNYTNRQGIRMQLPESVSTTIQAIIHRDKKKPNSIRPGHFISMAITELLAVIAAILFWQEELLGGLIVIVIDNSNALHWIRSRGAKNLYAQALLRLLARLEIRGQFTVWAEEVRSEENELPDAASRIRTREGRVDLVEEDKLERLWMRMFGTSTQIQHLPRDFLPPEWFQSLSPYRWEMKISGESNENFSASNTESTDPPMSSSLGARRVSFADTPITISFKRYGMMNPLPMGERQAWLRDLQDAVNLIEAHVLASRTRSKYEKDFKSWTDFRRRTDDPVYLHELGKAASDQALRQYIGYLGITKGLKFTTVAGYLSAIRHYHVGQGYADPTASSRVRSLLKGLKRLQGTIETKRPVTPEMMRYIKTCLDFSVLREVFVWAGLTLGFSFLLRASEYVGETEETFDNHKVMRRKDVVFRRGGKVTNNLDVADEVDITIRASKTDQYGEGVRRSLKRTGGYLCVVTALINLFKATQSITNDTTPLLLLPSGYMISRSSISDLLKRAARDLGHTDIGISSHSLRGGGATALYAANYTIDEICFFGRWSSNSWLRYVKMSRGRLGNVAQDLEEVQVNLYHANSPRTRPRQPPQGKENLGNDEAPTPLPGARWLDREENQSYVVIHSQWGQACRRIVTYYTTLEAWEREGLQDRQLTAIDAYHLLESLHLLYYSLPEEVNSWLGGIELV
jgi:hypothetical protein